MKSLVNLFITSFIFVLTAYSQETNLTEVLLPERSPKSLIEQSVGLTKFKISYNRPSKKGRVIFGNLVPFGDLWRTGANANTTITASTPFTIAKKQINAGTYAIFTIPNKEYWEIILYSDHNGWGTPEKIDESKIVLKTKINTKHLTSAVESFSINFTDLNSNKANLNLEWENTRVTIPIYLDTKKYALNNINSFLSPHELNFRKMANYLISEGIELEKSLDICDQIIEKNKGQLSGVWGYHFKALAYKKLNKPRDSKSQIEQGIKYVNSIESLSNEYKKELINILKENKIL